MGHAQMIQTHSNTTGDFTGQLRQSLQYLAHGDRMVEVRSRILNVTLRVTGFPVFAFVAIGIPRNADFYPAGITILRLDDFAQPRTAVT